MFPIITAIILVVILVIILPEILAFVAKIKFANGDLKASLKWFAIANRFGKLGIESLRYYGYILLRDGQFELAKTVLTRASLDAKKPAAKKRVKAMLALCEWKCGNLDLAIDMSEEAMVDFENTNIYQNLGLMYVLSGNGHKALEFNKKAYEYNSDDMVIMDNLAESYALVGDTAKAAEMYEKLLEKEPHFPEPYYAYGQMLCDMGEKERGIELIEQSLEKRFTHLSVLQKEDVEKILENVKEN